MKILIIHQNFPGQYKHLGPALVAQGHEVAALTPKAKQVGTWNGIRVYPYKIVRGSARDIHPWLADFETKLIRGDHCYQAAIRLRDEGGFTPDLILAHFGWGESLFLRDVWPDARIGLYCELYHRSAKPFVGFDPEFESPSPGRDALRLRMKNINNLLHFQMGDAGISPTHFQADTYPAAFRDRISVIHDGVDTDALVPDPDVRLEIKDGPVLTRADEVITFVNRNLEPYRGYHVFMRALPRLLKARPNARVLIVGGDEVSYGARPPKGQTWKQIFIDEVRGRIPTPDWNRVHFLGRIPYDQFTQLLQVSRLHIYLTYPFVLSWSLLEAMSVEAAILASGTDPVREAITHDENGRLVDFFDGDALVDQAVEMLEDAALRERLGKAARAHARAHYDLKTVCLPRQLDWVEQLGRMAPRPIPV